MVVNLQNPPNINYMSKNFISLNFNHLASFTQGIFTQKRPPDQKKWEENPRFLRKISSLHKYVLGETKNEIKIS